MKRIIPFVLTMLSAAWLLTACSSSSSSDKKSKESDSPALIETGELAAVNSKAFVMCMWRTGYCQPLPRKTQLGQYQR